MTASLLMHLIHNLKNTRGSFKIESLPRSVAESLQRLGVDYIDVIQVRVISRGRPWTEQVISSSRASDLKFSIADHVFERKYEIHTENCFHQGT